MREEIPQLSDAGITVRNVIMKVWKKLSSVLQAALITFALRMQYVPVLNRADYKSRIHYLYAQVTNLLGEYSFIGLLIFLAILYFVCHVRQREDVRLYKKGILPYFFSFCLLIGQSCAQEGGLSLCFGSVFRVAAFLLSFAGYAILFRYFIALFFGLYKKAAVSKWGPAGAEVFLGQNCFRNVFLLLMILWAPVILLSYPGNLCYDFLGQIEQGLGITGYSTHHPLLHTLIATGLIKFGRLLTGSADFGLFLYVILQAAVLAAALAATVDRLAKRGVSCVLKMAAVCVYVLAPMYSNIASTAVKDVPFMAAFLWYILLLEDLLAGGVENRKPMYWVRLTAVQVLVGLLRNNGVYVVVLTGVVLAVIYRKKILLLCTAVLPLVICLGGNGLLAFACGAEAGSPGEMFSIPFQQTARYLQLYGDELTEEEQKVIAEVLTDPELVAERYDPNISDPVKALYLQDCGPEKLAAYFKVWFTGFFKHPSVYLEAFFIHVYGWFDPGVTNAIRYEAQSDLFRQGGLISGADKLLLFVYRFAEYIPFLAVLENVGVYTWLLFLLGGKVRREKCKKGILLAPLFISLLICMAAPCFYLHPRYAFPIMFTVPFLYGIMGEEAAGGRNHGSSSQDLRSVCTAAGSGESTEA